MKPKIIIIGHCCEGINSIIETAAASGITIVEGEKAPFALLENYANTFKIENIRIQDHLNKKLYLNDSSSKYIGKPRNNFKK